MHTFSKLVRSNLYYFLSLHHFKNMNYGERILFCLHLLKYEFWGDVSPSIPRPSVSDVNFYHFSSVSASRSLPASVLSYLCSAYIFIVMYTSSFESLCLHNLPWHLHSFFSYLHSRTMPSSFLSLKVPRMAAQNY